MPIKFRPITLVTDFGLEYFAWCSECGAMIKGEEEHQDWHAKLAGLPSSADLDSYAEEQEIKEQMTRESLNAAGFNLPEGAVITDIKCVPENK